MKLNLLLVASFLFAFAVLALHVDARQASSLSYKIGPGMEQSLGVGLEGDDADDDDNDEDAEGWGTKKTMPRKMEIC